MTGYDDRVEAGEILAGAVAELDLEDPVIVGLPRGGVIVARPVADRLDAPLDMLIVRKLGHPSQPELAMGAIAEGGAEVLAPDLLDWLGVAEAEVDRVRVAEREELDRRIDVYRVDHPRIALTGRSVVVIDDGLATGLTARAAERSARDAGAREVLLAVPVAAPAAVTTMQRHYDAVICPLTPRRLRAVGEWYRDFDQVTDEEVLDAMAGKVPRSGWFRGSRKDRA